MARFAYYTDIPESVQTIYLKDVEVGRFFCFCSDTSAVCMVVNDETKQYFCFDTDCVYDVDDEEKTFPVYILDATITISQYLKSLDELL